MPKILLVDDDPLITKPIARSLQQHGYQVLVANNGRKGLTIALEQQPDLVVLDIMMPEMDGWAVCKELRAQSGVPILMLTALEDEVDRILGLELGADDFLTKPISARELLARIRAMLRRVELDKAEPVVATLTSSDLVVELENRQVYKSGELLNLRYKEFELLVLLMNNLGQVVTRAQIFDDVWGTDWLGDTRTLDVHIRWLREKIEDDPGKPTRIQTVRGVGYRFTAG